MYSEIIKRIIKAVIFFVPFILGTIGYLAIGEEALHDALFHAIGFYTLNNIEPAENILIELARWTAPLMTASGLVMAVSSLKRRFKNRFIYLKGGSVAIFGPQEETSILLGQLRGHGIQVGDESRFPKAERYILMGQEDENFLFYQKYYDQLAGKLVYLKCSSMMERATGANLNLFFEEEIAARLFWKRQNLYREAKQKNFCLKIIFTRFGLLEEQLLLWGLQNNIFHPEQEITYHVFGRAERFRAVYHELSMIDDPVVFHEEPWYDALDLFAEADRIIVSDTSELLGHILFAIPEKRIDVLAVNQKEVLHYESQERLRIFFWRREAEHLPNILEEKLLERAKAINLRYAHLYSGAAEIKENIEYEWGKLNTFTRYSNISSADYHEVRLQMIEDWKQETGKAEPDASFMMELAELEHIRWNRYHYINNWRYGIAQNGKNKDSIKKIHKDLVPFSELTEAEKEKDVENIRVLLSI